MDSGEGGEDGGRGVRRRVELFPLVLGTFPTSILSLPVTLLVAITSYSTHSSTVTVAVSFEEGSSCEIEPGRKMKEKNICKKSSSSSSSCSRSDNNKSNSSNSSNISSNSRSSSYRNNDFKSRNSKRKSSISNSSSNSNYSSNSSNKRLSNAIAPPKREMTKQQYANWQIHPPSSS